ncbi:MAG: hypothetical protein K6E92_03735 [Lachnospiraceae bacterium]|nr:hypothetical protein [Lachnospiraceae bacterium]
MDAKTRIKVLFVVRVCLWIVAAVSTCWWMYYSVKLHIDGIYDVHVYAAILRPVFYPAVLISVAAIFIAFRLYAVSKRLKDEEKHRVEEEKKENAGL